MFSAKDNKISVEWKWTNIEFSVYNSQEFNIEKTFPSKFDFSEKIKSEDEAEASYYWDKNKYEVGYLSKEWNDYYYYIAEKLEFSAEAFIDKATNINLYIYKNEEKIQE